MLKYCNWLYFTIEFSLASFYFTIAFISFILVSFYCKAEPKNTNI